MSDYIIISGNQYWTIPGGVIQRAYEEAEREAQQQRDARAREGGFENYAALQRALDQHLDRTLAGLVITT